jgi:tRNA (cytidine/uridine-2'-O-)-methyltransferase
MRLALFQPDIPQNCGAMLRLAACLAIPVDIIEPCGFILDDRRLKRAGLDYLSHARFTRHRSWDDFQAARHGRLVLLTTRGDRSYVAFRFRPGDTILVGRESAGVPQEVHEAADARLVIPIKAEARSLNVAQAASMVLGEALRQTNRFPIVPAGGATAPTKR